MRIFTFYSFKGGVGRSSLMFHLGDYWASKGHVVALLDMDLHAPGISLHPWLEKPEKKNIYHTLGISDLLATFYQTQNLQKQTFQFFSPSRMLRHLRPPKGSNRWGSKGRMLVLPSGQVALPQPESIQDAQAVKIPSGQDSASDDPEQKALRHFARLLREDLEAFRLPEPPTQSGIDFLLIDCRTGYLDMEELAMGYLAERVVLVSGLNHQNLEGLDITLQKLRPHRVPPLHYASELLLAFGPVPAHYMDDPQARQSLQKGMRILEKNRAAVTAGARAEIVPPCFLLPYTPHLATSDEPVNQDFFLGRRHPYWEVVEQIADTLVSLQSLEESQRETLQQLYNITGTVLPPAVKAPAEESPSATDNEKNKLEMEEEEEGINWKDRDPTRKSLALMFQLPEWHWPLADKPTQIRSWLRRHGLPAEPNETLVHLLNGLCASITLSPEEKANVLSSCASLSQFQLDSLIEVFQAENKKFAARSIRAAPRFMVRLLHAQQAWAELLCGQEKGEALFLSKLEKDPGPFASWKHYAAYWFALTTPLEEAGRYESAEAGYRKAIALDPENGAAWIFLGNLLQDHLGRPEESETAYRRAIELNPEFALSWNGLGNLLQVHLNRHEESEAAYRRAIELDPKSAVPWNGLGNLLQDHLNRHEESEAAYRRAIELDPKDAIPWNGLGNLLQNHLNRYEESEAAYRRAIELDPKFAAPWNGLGNLLQDHLNRHEESEAAYRRAIELDPKFAAPWNGLGDLLQDHLNRHEESEAAYRRAIELDPKFAAPWNGLALLYTNTLQCQEARQCYRQGLALDPDSPYLFMNMGSIKLISGEDWQADSLKALAGFEKQSGLPSIYNRIYLAVALSAGERLPSDAEMNGLFARWEANGNLHVAATLRALHQGNKIQSHLDRVMALLASYFYQRHTIERFYLLAGSRPDLREALRSAARQFFHLPQEIIQRFRDQPTPHLLERYRPFVEGRSDGAGDARDLALFCKDAVPGTEK